MAKTDPKVNRILHGSLFFILFLVAGFTISQTRSWFQSRRPDFLLITLDTMRADHVGAGPVGRPLTPCLDALARRGTVFLQTYSTGNNTMPSHTSILTSLHSLNHGVLSNRKVRLAENIRSIAEVFREAGYLTAASVSNEILTPSYLSGIERGFELFLGPAESAPPRHGEETVKRLLDELEKTPIWKPRFIWLHLFEPHLPYRPPASDPSGTTVRSPAANPDHDSRPIASVVFPEFWWELGWTSLTGYLEETSTVGEAKADYATEVHDTDKNIGNFLRSLDRLGRLGNTVIAITGDHGESLGERGVFFDHVGSHDPVLRVPLILCGPGVREGRIVKAPPVSTLDIAPTLLDLAHLPRDPEMRGRSLTPLIEERAGASDPVPVFATLHDGIQHMVRHGTKKLMVGAKVFNYTPRFRIAPKQIELYDLAEDPEEKTNLAQTEPREVERLLEILKTHLATQSPIGTTENVPLTDHEKAALGALGYRGE